MFVSAQIVDPEFLRPGFLCRWFAVEEETVVNRVRGAQPQVWECSKVELFCRGCVECWPPFPVAELPPAPSQGMAAPLACAGAAASRQIFWLAPVLFRPLFPFLFKLVPPQDVGKQVHIELRLFAQDSHAFAILAAPGLQRNRDQIFAAQNARRNTLIGSLLCLTKRLLD
jgi:hypothetical protein